MDYYLGLDMGTSTVGWAVTDKNYNLVRKKGKDLWGVREFEEAKTGADRRSHRISRRRRQREVARIGILKDYFADSIASVDPLFYQRLENSKYHKDDKDKAVQTKNGLFNDPKFTDVEYFKKYPTIFHLRRELIYNQEPHDVRLVFLAVLNMFKHRGHFLNAGVSSEETVKMEEAYTRFLDVVEEKLNLSLKSGVSDELEAILSNRDFSRSVKAEKINELLGIQKKDKQQVALVKTICGLKGDAKVLFGLEDLEEKVEIEFSSFGYEEKIPEIQEAIGDELFDVVVAMKEVYDIGSLAGILRGSNYLSDARVKEYEKHREDLKILKNAIRIYGTEEEYEKMFRSQENGTYSAYVNSTNSGEKLRRNMKGRSRDDFYATVKKLVAGYKKKHGEKNDLVYILDQIDKEFFMPKQLTASNGVIPYQVHEKELKKILKNAKAYLPFLNEVDESGLTVAERIIRLFSFQIPYYVGPLNPASKQNKGNGWVVRKKSGQVLPWNFHEKIDEKVTAKKFISKMVRKCTYISGETVLPKASLLYESYCVLNEINNIRINEERIDPKLKQDIYNELFKKNKKVTRKKLLEYLANRGIITSADQVRGIDTDINSGLSSYVFFKSVFGDIIDTDSGKKMVEDIISWCTVYGDSKGFLKEQIAEDYPDITNQQIKRITGVKFKDWGRFSKEFLQLEGCDKSIGESITIYRALWETSYNLMELLHSEDFTFKEVLVEKQTKALSSLSELTPEFLDEYYFSAPVKKMIWQTIGVIKELEEVLGQAPKKVFIEMTRTDEEKGDKGRKDSRKKQLLEIYKTIKNNDHNWKKLIEGADESGKLRSKKMYLYLLQMGRDMYTGETIDLDDLYNNNLYDIDHIYPRHFVKDDSIHNNLVLVRKESNAHKSDTYPLESSIRHSSKVQELWSLLRTKKLITEEKYRRLTGTKEFSEEQKADFIARQLVETGQATKGVADFLKLALPDTKIVYAKARNVSDFRQKYDLYKSRLINDFHHANDAYLNIVVGNVYLTKFTNNPRNFIKNEYMSDKKKNNYNLSRMFDRDVVRGDEIAWVASKKDGEAGTIVTVKKVMAKNTPLITKALVDRNGQLFDLNPIGKSRANDKNYVPLKTSDYKLKNVNSYGGYTSLKPAYLMVVEHGKDGKRKRTFESVPVIHKKSVDTELKLIEYCEKNLGLVNPVIIAKKIRLYSLLEWDGYYVRVTGLDSRKNVELHNAVSLCLSPKDVQYIKMIEKMANDNRISDEISISKNIQLYDLLTDKQMSSIYMKKPKPIGEMLKKGKKKFEKLDVMSQANVLLKILELSKLGATCQDMKIIGGSGEEGRMRISGNITNKESVKLINQSITGIFETKIDLLK